MKTIEILEDITCTDPRSGAVLCKKSMKDVAFEVWLNDSRAGNKPVDLYRWSKVCDAFTKAEAGQGVGVEDSEFEKLLTIVRDPQICYPPILAMQLLPFTEAVEKAK